MFDDKKQPDDMFAGEEESQKSKVESMALPASALLTPPPIAQKTQSGSGAQELSSSETDPLTNRPAEHRFGFVKVLLVVIVVLGLVAGAAYAAYRIMVAQTADDGIVNSVSDDGVVTDDEEGKSDGRDVVNTPDEEVKAPEEKETIFDSDGDGLNNAEELDAGTLSNNPDTDSDGLGDREEVKVYGTDPRDSDTDGDTFLDGQEVAGGYNPNGEGKLFNVPSNQ